MVVEEEDMPAFQPEKISPIISLARTAWSAGLPDMIQSGLEIETGGYSLDQLKKGAMPCIRPFSIVNVTAAGKSLHRLRARFALEELCNEGLLTIDMSLINPLQSPL